MAGLFAGGGAPFEFPAGRRVSPELEAGIPAPRPTGGMFGGQKRQSITGSKLKDFILYLAAARGSPVAQFGLQRFQRNQDAEAEEQNYQRRRGDSIEDYGKKQEIDAKYRPPVNNDTVADYQFILDRYGQEAADKYLYNTKVDPVRYLPTGDGGMMAIGGGGPPQRQGMDAPSGGGEVTATNPQTGQKVRLNPATGQWEPMGSPSNIPLGNPLDPNLGRY